MVRLVASSALTQEHRVRLTSLNVGFAMRERPRRASLGYEPR